MQILKKIENIFWKEQTKRIDVLNSLLRKVIIIKLQNYKFTKVSFKGFHIGNFVLIQLKKFKYWLIISSRK